MTETERESLIEELTGAFRERDPGGRIRQAPAFHDLDAAGRVRAFDETLRSRYLEAALDPEGLSSTARAVLGRLSR
jgi:hypothetical protein